MSDILFARSDEYDNEEEIIQEDYDRYLTFMSDNLIFGVSTDHVIEIIANYSIRQVPTVPEFVMGVINLRGQVLPVIDIRLRMDKAFEPYTNTTCIIILEIDSVMVGLAVDHVLQVQNINPKQASPMPLENNQELTNAMISLEDGSVVLLLDCSAVINTTLSS